MLYRKTRGGKLQIGALLLLTVVAVANVLQQETGSGLLDLWGARYPLMAILAPFLAVRALRAGVFVVDDEITVRRLLSNTRVPVDSVDHCTVTPRWPSNFELVVVTDDQRIETGIRSANPAEEFVPNLPPQIEWRPVREAD